MGRVVGLSAWMKKGRIEGDPRLIIAQIARDKRGSLWCGGLKANFDS